MTGFAGIIQLCRVREDRAAHNERTLLLVIGSAGLLQLESPMSEEDASD